MSETNEQRIYDRCIIRVGQLEAENAKLRELVRFMWHDARLLDANSHIDGMRLCDSKVKDYMRRMLELGVDDDD